MPMPKKWAQMRLATLGAKKGLSGEVSQSARTWRRSLPVQSGFGPPRNFGSITRPPTGWLTSPPPLLKTIVSR